MRLRNSSLTVAEVDCYGEVEGAQTSVASNDKTPEWYETVVFERSCSDYRDVTFSMIDSDANDKKGGDDDLVVECRFTLADFVHMRFTKPDAGLPDHMEEEQWALGESVKSKGCLAKQCVYTCMGQPADESSGFQFALAGMRFTSENGLKSCIVGGLAAKLGQASGGGMMTVDVADLI